LGVSEQGLLVVPIIAVMGRPAHRTDEHRQRQPGRHGQLEHNRSAHDRASLTLGSVVRDCALC